MTDMCIAQAIQQAEAKANELRGDCGRQHAQLAAWLRELLALREAVFNPVAETVVWGHSAHPRRCDLRLLRFDVTPGYLFRAPDIVRDNS